VGLGVQEREGNARRRRADTNDLLGVTGADQSEPESGGQDGTKQDATKQLGKHGEFPLEETACRRICLDASARRRRSATGQVWADDRKRASACQTCATGATCVS